MKPAVLLAALTAIIIFGASPVAAKIAVSSIAAMDVVLLRTVIGGLVAAILWEIVRNFLVWWFSNVSLVNVVYGSLAAVVIVLLTLETAAIILLLGAQVIAELEPKRDESRTETG